VAMRNGQTRRGIRDREESGQAPHFGKLPRGISDCRLSIADWRGRSPPATGRKPSAVGRKPLSARRLDTPASCPLDAVDGKDG